MSSNCILALSDGFVDRSEKASSPAQRLCKHRRTSAPCILTSSPRLVREEGDLVIKVDAVLDHVHYGDVPCNRATASANRNETSKTRLTPQDDHVGLSAFTTVPDPFPSITACPDLLRGLWSLRSETCHLRRANFWTAVSWMREQGPPQPLALSSSRKSSGTVPKMDGNLKPLCIDCYL